MPVLKGEHGAPVEPEVGGEHLIVKEIGDLFILQLLIRGKEQLHDLHGTFVGDGKLAVGVGILAALLGRTAERLIGILLVQPVILIQHAGPLGFQRGDGAQQVPHDLEVVVHLAAAAHDITDVILVAVTGTAGQRVLFKHVDALAFHLAVAHQVASRRQGCQAGTDEIGRFIVNTLRLFGGCKRFIVATGIIHTTDLLVVVDRLLAGALTARLFIGLSIPRQSSQNNQQNRSSV